MTLVLQLSNKIYGVNCFVSVMPFFFRGLSIYQLICLNINCHGFIIFIQIPVNFLFTAMNGAVITGTPIAVDYWRRNKSPSSKVFFLSHAHSDHTSGLSSTWRYPIYCSEVTGKVVVAKCGVKQSLIRTLSVGNGHIIPLDETGKETMTVTLIDANHCPGATIFLFEGYFGRFLYTGDFRFHPCMFSNTVLGLNRPVDRLYLDNTYNSPENNFPGEDDCKVKIMEVLAEYPYSNVVLGMHQLGKEDLLMDIAGFYGEKIQVTPERRSIIELLDCKDVFTTSEARIRVIPVHTITYGAVEQWNSEFPTIVIIPSAIFRSQRRSRIANHPSVFIIPYSSHSSYNELIQFVTQVRPRKVIPIVQPPPSKPSEAGLADMSNFDHYLDPTPPTPVSIPSSVQTYMNSHLSVPREVMRPSLRKRQSITDKRCVSKIAKGVVFEDANDDDSDTTENSKGYNTNSDCYKDCVGTELEKKAEKSEEDVAKSVWDVSTCSETAEKFKDQDQEPDLEKDTQDNEPKVKSPKWQVCPQTFYNKPKWIKRSPRKKSHHVCNHAQSGKSCLCKYIVVKEPKEDPNSVNIWDNLPSSSKTKGKTNETVGDCGKSATTNDEPCASSSEESANMPRNSNLHEGRPKRRVPSILSVDYSSRKDYNIKCYSAIQHFYKKGKSSNIAATC